jgi:predicted dehydrogenase
MLEDPMIEAVSVATPDFLHKEPLIACAEKGKHILCEKPLATTVEDAKEMVRAVERAEVTLMVDFHNRWNPPFALTKESVDKGELGEPIHAYIRLSDTIFVPTRMLSWADKSSVLWFLGSHTVDLARWILKSDAVEVNAACGMKILRAKGIDTPDYYQYMIRFENGATAMFENSWILPQTLPTIVDFIAELTFTKGCVYIDPVQHGAFRMFTEDHATYPNIIGGPMIVHGRRIGFINESIAHFVDCIVQDKEPVATGRDGLAADILLCSCSQLKHAVLAPVCDRNPNISGFLIYDIR